MKMFNFGTPNPVPIRLSDYPGLTARLRVAGTINAETDEESRGQMLKTICLTLLNETFAGYGDRFAKDDIARLTPELSRILSEKLTERSGITCHVSIVSMSLDEETQKIIDGLDFAAKMSDPEFAAKKIAEAEEEAKKALERRQALLDRAITSNDISFKGDCTPPYGNMMMPAGVQPGTSEMNKNRPPVPQPVVGIMAGHRPKFCANCGKPLPETGNFCGECGKPIM